MRIRWTPPAVRDFNHIWDYTEKHFGADAAQSLAVQIHGAIGNLVKFPQIGRPGRKPGTRELVFTGTPFLAIYRMREETSELLRILHGAQKWP